MKALVRILSIILLLVAGPAWADWPSGSAALGARDHPKVLQRFNGEVQNPAVSDYVARIGMGLVMVSTHPDDDWRFTVLDSGEVNAFALPGGYVYVTRGLLALVNSEAELAAVLAHEITHVVEAHVEARQKAQKDALLSGALNALATGIFGGGENRLNEAVRSGVETAFGQMGSYSKAQEFAADAGGIELLRLAGYQPRAQADFLASMAANARLKARAAGREYDEAGAPIFATHPAPAERQARALELAGGADGRLGRETYLMMIDGMVYGGSARGGYVDGQVFIHPELGFTFEAAPGLRVQNRASQINILGPGRATLIMTGAPDTGDLMDALRGWAAQVPRNQRRSNRLEDLRRVEINGLEAASGILRIRQRGQRYDLRMTVIRFNDRLIRFAGKTRRGDREAADLQWQTLTSFQTLENGAGQVAERYVTLHRVEPGDSVASLAARMEVQGFQREWFLVLNGMNVTDRVVPGMLVKLIGA